MLRRHMVINLLALMGMLSMFGCVSVNDGHRPVTSGTPLGGKPDPAVVEALTAEEFKAALCGDWRTVWKAQDAEYVQSMTISADGSARIVLCHGGKARTVLGSFVITFDREPDLEKVTLATITIRPKAGEPLILSRVNFGLHNGLPRYLGRCLRIDGKPKGVLKQRKNTEDGIVLPKVKPFAIWPFAVSSKIVTGKRLRELVPPKTIRKIFVRAGLTRGCGVELNWDDNVFLLELFESDQTCTKPVILATEGQMAEYMLITENGLFALQILGQFGASPSTAVLVWEEGVCRFDIAGLYTALRRR